MNRSDRVVRRVLFAVALFGAPMLIASRPARAQLSGDLIRGQYGLASGTQPPEGLVVSPFVYDYRAGTIVGPGGRDVPTSGSFNTFSPGLSLWWVSPLKVLGAHYGAQASVGLTSSAVEAPRFDASQSSFGFGDTYVKPFELGWHTTYVDANVGFGLYIPTGRYAPGGSDNSGQGQWDYEFSAGGTLWPDKGHHLNLATQAFFDLFSHRRGEVGPSHTELKTGDILALQGGLGYAFLDGGLNVGVPYFVQWTLTEDTLPPGVGGPILPGLQAAKAWSIGVGAEVDFNWSKSDGVTARWLQGFAGQNTTNGATFFLFYNHAFQFTSDKPPPPSMAQR
jgi:hypothetical protein